MVLYHGYHYRLRRKFTKFLGLSELYVNWSDILIAKKGLDSVLK
jgi:hypothetical protein